MKIIKKSLFGKYNPLVDEICQILVSLPSAILFYQAGVLKLEHLILLLFVSVFLIDLDHLFNPLIVKMLKLPKLLGNNKVSALKTLMKGEDPFVINGYNIQILHGIDLFFLFSFLVYAFSHDFFLATCLFTCLTIHLFWDFLVYPHSFKGLFVLLRIKNKFKMGERNFFNGIVFDKDSLLY